MVEKSEKKPITKKKLVIAIVISIVLSALISGVAVWLITGGYSVFMSPVKATIPQDPSEYGEAENKVIETSQKFWTAMENADENGMREIADEKCTFVHIGMTCELDEEIGYYTNGVFKPTSIVFHGRTVKIFGSTAVVIIDCDYSLRIGMSATTHHFAVTEVYESQNEDWKLIQFSFTALVS